MSEKLPSEKAVKAAWEIFSVYDPETSSANSVGLIIDKHLQPSEETQESISGWATETFGPAGSNLRAAIRANEEMSELLRCLAVDENHPKAIEEAADVVICLYRVTQRLGGNLMEAIDKKMAINRARQWQKDGSGHGYHVKTEVVR